MTCAACARAVTVRWQSGGVNAASVNFATEKLNVEYDESMADITQVIDAVKNAGYDVRQEEDKQIREVIIPISGMTCAA